ncbi:MAG: hypothetical protein WBJ10_15225 [Daejeonella sp.]|uniref:O-antigen ligase family protein n=1 Tax=Daejeonella sp. TaxID=2805397 RepID=UPI003C76E3F9
MLLIFPLIYILSFLYAVKEILSGNSRGLIVYLIFGLSLYTTALALVFNFGYRNFLPVLQSFKELLVIIVFLSCLWNLKRKLHFHFVDYAIAAFFFYTLLYAILPIGEQGIINRFIAFKTTSFFCLVYATARLMDPKTIYISKYFHYILLLAIFTAVVLMYEVRRDQHLQSLIGLADYNYYIFNLEPSGNYGLSWTFESMGGFKRFASIFASPLEHAGATLIALCVIAGVYTRDDYKFKPDLMGWIALGATALSIIFAISRSAFISYGIIIYCYAIITHKKWLLQLIHFTIASVIIYFIYYLTQEDRYDELMQDVIIDTLNFTHPSSVGHVLEWVQGIMSIYTNPLGIGMGSSGRIGGSLGENVGGENQYIIIGVQAGIIALLLYLSIYVSLIRNARKWYRKLTKKERQLALSILLIKIGFIIPSLTSETESSVYISYLTWFLTGIFISIISEKRLNNDEALSSRS